MGISQAPSLPVSDPGLADAARDRKAIYVHIPFCRRICPYCDFAVQAGGDQDAYVAALLGEIALTEPFDRPVDAIFVGGGTPTSVDPTALGRILRALDDRFGLVPSAEVSIEANPEDVDSATARAWVDVGFNRISLGVQSLDPVVLAALGRAHDPAAAERAIEAASGVFPSLNVDLIFGTPGETLASWEDSVHRVLEHGVAHLSTYALTVERGTPLSRQVAAGAEAPDPDYQADAYELAVELAGAAGLERYETSNMARPGHTCVYNMVTWAQGEYEAFGNGAHRHRNHIRSWNLRRVDRYEEAVAAGRRPTAGSEVREGWDAEVERVMLGLRRAAGVEAGCAGAALIDDPMGKRLLDAGVIEMQGDRLVVIRPLLGDEVTRTLLALDARDC